MKKVALLAVLILASLPLRAQEWEPVNEVTVQGPVLTSMNWGFTPWGPSHALYIAVPNDFATIICDERPIPGGGTLRDFCAGLQQGTVVKVAAENLGNPQLNYLTGVLATEVRVVSTVAPDHPELAASKRRLEAAMRSWLDVYGEPSDG